jgi:hypothetical protein
VVLVAAVADSAVAVLAVVVLAAAVQAETGKSLNLR